MGQCLARRKSFLKKPKDDLHKALTCGASTFRSVVVRSTVAWRISPEFFCGLFVTGPCDKEIRHISEAFVKYLVISVVCPAQRGQLEELESLMISSSESGPDDASPLRRFDIRLV